MKNFKTLVVFVCLLAFTSSFAQTRENPWAVGLYGVKSEYLGDLNKFSNEYTTSNVFNEYQNTTYNFNSLNVGGALSIDRFLNNYFDAGIYGSYSSMSFEDNITKPGFIRSFESASLINGNLHFRIKILGDNESRFVPFVNVAGGAAIYNDLSGINYKGDTVSTKDPVIAITATLGLGLEYKISDKFSIRYQSDLSWTSKDDVDYYERSKSNDYQFQHNLGIVYSFSFKKKDKDKDGVFDKKDNCLGTPLGVQVDSLGCPIDTDKDGIADYLDKCPNTSTKAKVDSLGCPIDTDKDGIADYMDKCPKTPAEAKVDANGCAIDTDKDGVADYLDKCPNTGIGATVDANGCAIDTDKDGVADYLDKCPEEAGIVENKGCPEVKEEVKKVLTKALQGIQFQTGKDIIRKKSLEILDDVVLAMNKNLSYNLEINGHTDNEGGANNLELSQKRADAVKNYLVEKGVDTKRLTAKGFGDTIPIASNNTKKGRSENRRVEFKIVF